jgi:hypothetical protein
MRLEALQSEETATWPNFLYISSPQCVSFPLPRDLRDFFKFLYMVCRVKQKKARAIMVCCIASPEFKPCFRHGALHKHPPINIEQRE